MWAFPSTIPEVHYLLPSEPTDIMMTGSRFKVIYLPAELTPGTPSPGSPTSRNWCQPVSLSVRCRFDPRPLGHLRYTLHPPCALPQEAVLTRLGISWSDLPNLIWRPTPFFSVSKFYFISLDFLLQSWGLLLFGAGFLWTHGLTFYSHLMHFLFLFFIFLSKIWVISLFLQPLHWNFIFLFLQYILLEIPKIWTEMVSERVCKQLRSCHCATHTTAKTKTKKTKQRENQELFLEWSENWGHGSDHWPERWKNRQVYTENHSLRGRNPQTETSSETRINYCF